MHPRQNNAKARGEAIPAGARYLFAFLALLLSIPHVLRIPHASASDAEQAPYRLFHPDIAPWGDSESRDGFIVRIVETAFERAGLPHEVVYAPWKREQASVQKLDNAFMAPLTRLESRERLYQWIAPVNISYLELVTLKPEYSELPLEYRYAHPIAARMESPAEFWAHRLGFTDITLVENEDVAAKLVKAGRVAFWAQRGLPGDWAYERAGGNPRDLIRLYRTTTPEQYLVASLGVPTDVVDRLRTILEDMRTSGEIDRIKQSFFKHTLDCELLFQCRQRLQKK